MEENVISDPERPSLDLNQGSLSHLNEIRKLAKFIGIVMLSLFVMICIGMLAIIIIGLTQNGGFLGTTTLIAGISLIAVSVIYLLAFIYLSRFSARIGDAFAGSDTGKAEMAFLNMKYFFRLIAIVLILYIVGFIILVAVRPLFL
jgi:hypothetical protein